MDAFHESGRRTVGGILRLLLQPRRAKKQRNDWREKREWPGTEDTGVVGGLTTLCTKSIKRKRPGKAG